MHRGHLKHLTTCTLIVWMVAGPAFAQAPGDVPHDAVAEESIGSEPVAGVQTALGLRPLNAKNEIRQVVGKQPGSRTVNPDRSVSLIPSLFGRGDQHEAASPNNQTPSSAHQHQATGGLLGELFGNHSSSPPPQPPAAERAPVNWQGIPYHQAKSHSTAGTPQPIRDPKPGETRLAPRTSAPPLPAPALSGVTPPTRSSIPQPPALAPAPSSRRGTPAKLASSRSSETLSSRSSSRRSGRRDVPGLDVSEIEAAHADSVSEEQVVPKIARHPIQADTDAMAKSETAAAADTPAPAPTPTTPALDVPRKQLAKSTSGPATATISDEGMSAIGGESDQVAAAPQPAAESPQAAPSAESANSEIAATSSPRVSNDARRGLSDNFMTSRPTPVAASPTPSASVPPAAGQPAAATAPMAVPAAPTFGTSGSVAGYRSGPPASAFTPEFKPQPSVETAPVGSGVMSSASESANNGVPHIAAAGQAQPTEQVARPQAAYPADPYATETYASGASSEVTLGTPTPSHTSVSPLRHPAQPPAADPFERMPVSDAAVKQRRQDDPRQLAADQTAVASELPGIRVVTHGPSSVIIRQTHEFEIRVENRGSIDAAGVMVRALVPDWAEVRGQTASRGSVENRTEDSGDRLVWSIDSLPAGTSERMFVRLRAQRSGKHGLDVDWTLVPQKSIATIEVREPKLDLLIEGPEEVVYGESQTYKVRVLNPGDGMAPNVVFTLSPDSPTPQTQRIGNIPSGKEAQFEVELTAQDLGDLKIHGLASGDLGLRAEADKTIRVSAAELEAVLSGPALQYQNTDAVYHLEVINHGSAASKNIEANLALPVGVKYLGGIDTAKQRGTRLTWTIESLPAGATRDYEFQCGMNSPGEKSFEFSAKGTAAGQTSVALATQVESIADLVMTIQDPTAPAPIDAEVVYEITVKNRGSREAKGVRAVAQFSNGIEPRRIEGQTGQVLTGQVLFDPIERIRPGEEVHLRVIAEAETAGHHRFRTEIRSGETVLVAEEATHYMSKRVERVSRRSARSSVE
ncbi:hypothetical protein FYK55_08385 [Roseiconus nitratireducens]|uniref:DUF11 domain-containing protein n=1 Tax=Roseiconus nitratireducens TaxID=2605748 RepID=A0A5M6DD13_9BACT|nr:DUF11 domain-containing protein [Roseiconus nitratireducens]KAA5544356.1 hypothetical protein FYK55_08385 [Roseiconus nitratireducens]